MRKAITTMNGSELEGRQLRVKKAVPKERIQKKVSKIIERKKMRGIDVSNRKPKITPQEYFYRKRHLKNENGGTSQEINSNKKKFIRKQRK